MRSDFDNILPEAKPLIEIPHRLWADHPKPGMQFPDMALAMRNGPKFSEIIDGLSTFVPAQIDSFVGIDVGGASLAGALAARFGRGYVEMRKIGNMRPDLMRVLTSNYALGDGVGVSSDGVRLGQKAIIVDDCIVSGSVAVAGVNLLRRQGVEVNTALFAFEITDAGGRTALEKIGVTMHSLMALHSSGKLASGMIA
ncbi:MAG: phosphoribosyltransferase family protein [Beijerinckiaceae bacterium]